MSDPFLSIASELGYRKAGRLNSLSANDKYDIINFSLKESIRGTYAILFLPHSMIQITPYGSSYGIAMPIPGRKHYLTIHPRLEDKYFRQIFTAIEMILFKLCHICLEGQKSSYKFDNEGTLGRLKRLREVIAVDDWDDYVSRFKEVWFVRDAFAHTFIDLDKIKFKGVPLVSCFGTTWTGSRHDEVDFTFVDEFEAIFDPLMTAFVQRQKEQIDAEKFYTLCDAELTPRTLGR